MLLYATLLMHLIFECSFQNKTYPVSKKDPPAAANLPNLKIK